MTYIGNVSVDIIGAWRREMVRAICRQQSENPSSHVCECMAPDGIGFGHFPAALLCRDTYDEIIYALTPIITQAKAKWQAEAFEMAAKVAEESADQCGDTIPGRARNATAVEIAEAIRALKDS